ncbi:MAG TPA: VOC family protein [Sphingobacteriaceae bacterium]|nr:VOC family protein [Sphingobacteriaceae bacterium]
MKGSIIPYMMFNGETQEAADFYANLFGLENVGIRTYADAGVPAPDGYIIHCHLQRGDFQIMLSDSTEPLPDERGRGLSLTIQCESEEEINRLYDGLRAEGTVLMELDDTFWGAKYAKVRDRFGYTWDLNWSKPA